MGKYMSVIGMFVIGVVIVVLGVYFFMAYSATPGSTEYILGVVLMLIGLLVTGMGAISGKRKMRSVGFFAQYPDAYSRSAPMMPVQQAPAQQTPVQPRPAPMVQPSGARPTPSTPANQPKPKAIQEKQAPKVIKILVCPKCGSENQISDTFCFDCGKKLKPKKSASK